MKRQVKHFHFENAGKILCCPSPISILSVQTALQIWHEIYLKQIYIPGNLLLTKKCHQPPGLYPLGKWGSFAVTPGKGRTNMVMWNKDSFRFAWLLLEARMRSGKWSREIFSSAVCFFPLPCYSLPLGFGQDQTQYCSSTRQIILVFFSEKWWSWRPWRFFSRGFTVNSEKYLCLFSQVQLWPQVPGREWWGQGFKEVPDTESQPSRQEPSSSLTSSSSSPVVFPCSSWKRHWGSTPAREASLPGGRSVPFLKVSQITGSTF